jgi:hypothetical protein
MRSIHQLIDHKLTLVKPKWAKYEYELRFGDEVIAKISFPKALSMRAEVITADGTWSLWREGIFKRKLLARQEGESNNAATGTASGWKGITEVIFPDGKKYLIKSNAWKTLTEILKETGEVVISIKTEGFFRNTTTITMNRTAAVTPVLPLLVMFGIYIGIANRRDSQAAVIAAST